MSRIIGAAAKRRTFYRTAMASIALAMGGLVAASRVFDVQLHALTSALVLAAVVVSVLQFRSLDEVAKQAHYEGWLWGSMAAMGVVGVCFAILYTLRGGLILPVEAPLIRIFGDAAPDTAYMAGFITAPLLMVLGFLVWWSAYWLRRR